MAYFSKAVTENAIMGGSERHIADIPALLLTELLTNC